ncbi:hypothetical protein F5141DRAFT_649732 [Pisolithus sp. B1]|nr:hypothetical protein F5141DRAFT_649732 [Pisolithus sp. B1]
MPQRPMKIEIVIDPARPAPQSLASRVAPATAAAVAPVRAARPATRGRRGPKSRRKTTERPQKSVADLDCGNGGLHRFQRPYRGTRCYCLNCRMLGSSVASSLI